MRIRSESLLLVAVLMAAPLVAQTTARTANTPAKTVVAAPAHKAVSSSHVKNSKRKAVGKKSQPEQPPTPPPPPPTPEEMPPAPPQVSYQNGQLTIQSQNSTLSDILNAVRRQTGTQMDVPPLAASQRIATRLGPGSPRDVLTALLNGSKFDYVILGSANTPGGVQRLILTPRTGGSASTPAVAQSAPMQGNAAAAPEPEPAEEEQPTVEENQPEPMEPQQGMPEQPQPEQAQPQPGPGQPIGEPAGGVGQQPGQPVQPQNGQPIEQGQPNMGQQQNNQGQPQVKTPEQLLQELQRMQQQQQQQQQQNPPE